MSNLLLIHSDTTNGDVAFEDSSGNGVVLTPVGNVQHSTAQSVLGQSSSIYFDGSGDYLSGTLPSAIGPSDFTIDFWFRRFGDVGASAQNIFITGTAGAGAFAVYSDTSGEGRDLNFFAAGADRLTSAPLTIGVWVHCAVVRSSGVTKLYINGIDAGGSYTDANNYSVTSFTVGYTSSTIYGYLSELRITNTAEYTSNFIPPTRHYNAALTTYYDTIVRDRPVNYWRLGEASGDAIDEVGQHDLTWAGTPVYGETGPLVGDSNTAMTLDGATEWANKNVADYRGSDTQGSIEYWINTTTTVTGAAFATCAKDVDGSLVAFEVRPTGTISYTHFDFDTDSQWDGVESTTTVNDGNWHHCVVTSDGSTVRIYIDGVEETLNILGGTNDGKWFGDDSNLRDNLTIGLRNRLNPISPFEGSLAEVAVYNYPLTPEQIKSHYLAGQAQFYAARLTIDDPVNWWRLDELCPLIPNDDFNIWNDQSSWNYDTTVGYYRSSTNDINQTFSVLNGVDLSHISKISANFTSYYNTPSGCLSANYFTITLDDLTTKNLGTSDSWTVSSNGQNVFRGDLSDLTNYVGNIINQTYTYTVPEGRYITSIVIRSSYLVGYPEGVRGVKDIKLEARATDKIGEHHLTWYGTPVYGDPGPIAHGDSYAMTLDGATEYATKQGITNYRSTDSSGAIEVWFKTTSTASGYLCGSGGVSDKQVMGIYQNNGVIGAWVRNTSYNHITTNTTGWNDGAWHHLILVSTGSTYQFYVDGVLEAHTNVALQIADGTWFGGISNRDEWTIGGVQAPGIQQMFGGLLSDIAVYNYPLTPDEVKAHYNIGVWTELPYSVFGIVYDDTASPCSRTVRLYNRNTGELISQTISDPTTGEYTFALSTQDELQRIVLDDESGTFYNDLIDRVIPG
jgi:hypothetical protein